MKQTLTLTLTLLVASGLLIRAELPQATAAPAATVHASPSPIAPRKVPVRYDGKTPESARKLAQQMTASRGWNRGEQWRCLFRLWQKESGWRHNADNKHSSAYGIPQLLGLSESTPPARQIQRGLAYVVERYGSPCKAYDHQQRRGWY